MRDGLGRCSLGTMKPSGLPEGTPVTQREWECLSETMRRWVVEAAAEVKRRELERAKRAGEAARESDRRTTGEA